MPLASGIIASHYTRPPTVSINANPTCIDVSSNGEKIYVGAIPTNSADRGEVFTSSTSGSFWNIRDVGGSTERLKSIACSADGTKIVAASWSRIWVSVNSGITWKSTILTSYNWRAVCCSDDFSVIYATEGIGGIIKSTDGGETWTRLKGLDPNDDWCGIACSSDGQIVYAGEGNEQGIQFPHSATGGSIYKSVDYGNNWTITFNTKKVWKSIACSSDGNIVYAADREWNTNYFQGGLYKTTNQGTNWAREAQVGNQVWLESVACSRDGNQAILVGSGSGVFVYFSDSGWSAPLFGVSFYSCSIDDNGSMFAGKYGGTGGIGAHVYKITRDSNLNILSTIIL